MFVLGSSSSFQTIVRIGSTGMSSLVHGYYLLPKWLEHPRDQRWFTLVYHSQHL